MEKKANKVIEGEALDIIIGNMPLKASKNEKEKEAVKAAVVEALETTTFSVMVISTGGS